MDEKKNKDYSKYKDVSFGVGELHTGRVVELYDKALDKVKDLKVANKIVTDKYKAKGKNIYKGIKTTIDSLRNPKDKKFVGHTDNKNK